MSTITIRCNSCDETLVVTATVAIAKLIKDVKWQRTYVAGQWKFYCPECQEETQ